MQNIQRSAAIFVLGLMGCAFHAGCGGAASKESATPDFKASTLSDDFAALDYNEGLISQALGYPAAAPAVSDAGPGPAGGDPSAGSAATSPATSPPPPPASAAPAEMSSQKLYESGGDERGSQSPCEIACRALSSMKRSADHVCEISSEQDERCSRAQNRVAQAGERVRRHCTGC